MSIPFIAAKFGDTNCLPMSKPLLKDLPELVKAGIITPETAEKITAYYESQKSTPSNKFTIVLGILGALLAGFGIVLVVAHNWEVLNRLTQTVLAFIPLAVTQALCIYTVLKKKDSMAWRESSAVLLFFAIAACISLISQIYHISGTLSGFLMLWILLTIPLVYLLPSSLVSLLLIGCGTWYACLVGYNGIFDSGRTAIPWFYIGLLIALAPHYIRYFRFNRYSNFFHLHNWFLVASLVITFGAFTGDYNFRFVFLAYVGLFGVFYLLGSTPYFKENRLFANPLYITGILGTLVIFFIWSFGAFWDESFYGKAELFFDSPFFVVNLVLLVLVAFLNIKHNKPQFDPVGFSPYLFLIGLILWNSIPGLASFLINIWLLAIAVFFIRRGSLRNHLGILNFGLIIIAILAILRFFDDNIPFVWRGLFFLAAGAGFFVANYLLLKKRKTITQNTNA